MRPPTQEEDDMANNEFMDDGFGLNFDEKDPWSIQEALDDIQRELRIEEVINNVNIQEWEDGRHRRRGHILTLVQNRLREQEITSLTHTFENEYKASIELEEAQCQYRLDEVEYEEDKKWAEEDIALKRRKVAVLEDLIKRSLCGDLVERIDEVVLPVPWEVITID
jgi:hypothetical protein